MCESKLFLHLRSLGCGNWTSEEYFCIKGELEACVEDPVGRRIPDIWIVYIQLEIQRGNLILGAKKVFYRAIRFCAWCKRIWMFAFSPEMCGFFSMAELKDILNVIDEKGILKRHRQVF